MPYNIVDREDISLNQKMIAIYLARIQDEKGPGYSPTVAEIAAKLKLSQEEVNLSLDFLVGRGILSRNQIEVREAGFDSLDRLETGDFRAWKTPEQQLVWGLGTETPLEGEKAKPLKAGEEMGLKNGAEDDAGDGFSSEEAGDRHKRKEQSGEPKPVEGLELTEENMNSLLEALELAEERVRERASQLKLNVRKRKRALNQAQAMEELEKAQERLREAEKEEPAAPKEDVGAQMREKPEQGAYDEVDELLKLLENTAKDEGREVQGAQKKAEREEARLKNRNFQKVSSVYNSVKSSLPRSKAEAKRPR